MKHRMLFAAFVGLIGFAVATSPSEATSATKGKATAATASKPKPVKSQSSKARRAKAAPGPLADAALAKMFRGKTWLWEDGAAYFAPEGGFVAWAGKDAGASFADAGSWRTAPNGRLCFRANWVSRAGTGAAESCFAHLLKSGDLLQRKEPDGEWYVFKHQSTRPDDEYKKLVTGDKASAEARKIMQGVKGS